MDQPGWVFVHHTPSSFEGGHSSWGRAVRWFKHMTDAGVRPFIRRLVRVHKSEGYHVWFALLEIVGAKWKIHKNENPQADIDIDYLEEYVSLEWKRIERVLKLAKDRGKLSYRRKDNRIHVEIPKLTEYLDEYSQRKSGESRDISRESPDSVGTSVPIKRSEEKRREEKRREEEGEEKPTPPLMEGQIPTHPNHDPTLQVYVATYIEAHKTYQGDRPYVVKHLRKLLGAGFPEDWIREELSRPEHTKPWEAVNALVERRARQARAAQLPAGVMSGPPKPSARFELEERYRALARARMESLPVNELESLLARSRKNVAPLRAHMSPSALKDEITREAIRLYLLDTMGVDLTAPDLPEPSPELQQPANTEPAPP